MKRRYPPARAGNGRLSHNPGVNSSQVRLASGSSHRMRVLGIDCGGAYTRYGVVEIHTGGRLSCLTCGAIKLSTREALPRRLSRIFTQLGEIIPEHQPDQVAIEDVFYALNVKSNMKLRSGRGVAMLPAAAAGPK